MSRGTKTLWIYTGVFLFMCVLVIVMTQRAVPLALCLPSVYCMYSEKSTIRNAVAVGLIPAVLIFLPAFFHGVILYLCLLGCGMLLMKYVRSHKYGLAVLAPACLMFFAFMLSIGITAGSENMTYHGMVSRLVQTVMDQVAMIYESMLSPGDMMQFKISRTAIEARIIKVFPSIMATSFAFIMWINLLIVSGIKRDVLLKAWKCPDWIVALFILACVFTLISTDSVNAIGLNLLIVVSQVYFYQGMAIVASFMAEYNWAKIIRWIIYVLILSQIYIMIIISTLGLFDTWFNFRKRIRNTKGDEK
ncbi:MAG: DUF2232 domain-containing protein [Deltaproteobacteria bacterium]|nr:DUF2232 domain-containing protein [Deltaproteobacteria bacterium]